MYIKKGQGAPTILIAAVVVTILVLTGLVILFAMQQEPEVAPSYPYYEEEEAPPVTETITEEQPPEPDDNYYYESALGSKNSSLCNFIGNQTIRQLCYENLSMESLDACGKVSNRTLLKNCITNFAVSLGNISICELLDNESTECKKAVNPCYELEGAAFPLCMALSENDSSECQGNPDCILNYSITRDEDHCGEIEDTGKKGACFSVLKDTDRCYEIASPSQKDLCYYYYALYSDNGNICHSITHTSLYAVDCLSVFAVRKGDPTFCDVSELEFNDQWNCYINYTMLSRDISGCSYIHELATTHRFECYYTFATEYGDPGVCHLLNDPRMTSTCYIGTVIDNPKLNLSTCGDVPDMEWRNKCYTESAKLHNDSSICDNIIDEGDQWVCLNAYDVYISQQD